MSLYGASAEYGLHCLLYLVDPPPGVTPSSRDLAEFQGVSPSYLAKLFTQLEKAGLVASSEGTAGGYRLARPIDEITVLDVVDALEGGKPLFQCREVRDRCVLGSCHVRRAVAAFAPSMPSCWRANVACAKRWPRRRLPTSRQKSPASSRRGLSPSESAGSNSVLSNDDRRPAVAMPMRTPEDARDSDPGRRLCRTDGGSQRC